MDLPSLASLETFLAVVRLGSFRRAAAERQVEPSAVSHTIRTLEEALGARLLHRTSRSLRLTEAGERLRDTAQASLGDLRETIAAIGAAGAKPSGRLRLNVPRAVSDLLIQPMIGRFVATYPEVAVEIVSDDGLLDIVAEGFDAGIRPGHRLAPGMIAVPVGPPRRFAVVGAPAYFARHDVPLTPQDLLRHDCIERRFPGGGRYAWEFARGAEQVEIEVGGRLVVDDSQIMRRAALDGVGLAHMHDAFVMADIAAGSLIRVLEDWCPPLGRFSLYYPGRRQVPSPLRAFIDMLRAGQPRSAAA